jgi:hypothetical protein
LITFAFYKIRKANKSERAVKSAEGLNHSGRRSGPKMRASMTLNGNHVLDHQAEPQVIFRAEPPVARQE